MKEIINHIKEYFYGTDKRILALVTLLTGILIFLNYHFGIDDNISAKHSFALSFFSRYAIFLMAFGLPWLFYGIMQENDYWQKKPFLILLLFAPALFSLKIAMPLPIHFTDDTNWNQYWNNIFYWPLLLVIIGGILFIIWKIWDNNQPFYGIKTKAINWKPYLRMLMIMIPFVAIASTQPDFLAAYPKLKTIEGLHYAEGLQWWHKFLFELSYGTDFITIELFFRGFLILAFVKWAGKDAILPMACFYCTIHFGKPLGECISSYFGGLILGVIVYHTRSIFGGLIVHLGIAWMMEIGGYIGNRL